MTRPTHIVCIVQSMTTGGAARVILNLVNALDPARFRVTILRLFDPLQYEGQNLPHVQFARAASANTRPNHYPSILAGVLRATRSADIIIGGQEGLPHLLALIAARLWRKPCIDWVHTTWSEFLGLPGVTRGTRLACKSTRLADRVVACSQGSAASADAFAQFRTGRLSVVHNGFPIDQIRERAREPIAPDLAKAFDLPVVVGVGRFHLAKGFDHLLHAHRHAIDHNAPPHRLMIVGDGHDRPQLEALASSLRLTDSVIFAGMHANPYPLIARARLFALSSRYEGLPTVLIESLILGVPPVAFDCPSGPREILNNGLVAPLITPESPEELGKAIAHELAKGPPAPAHTQALRQRGEDFSIDRAARAWTTLFDAVLHPSARPPSPAATP